jgi:hypothetical protein
MKKTGLALKIAVIGNAIVLVAVFVGCRALTPPIFPNISPVMPHISPPPYFPNIAPPPPPPPPPPHFPNIAPPPYFPSIVPVGLPNNIVPPPPLVPKTDKSVPQS